jgi:hypothetical protein
MGMDGVWLFALNLKRPILIREGIEFGQKACPDGLKPVIHTSTIFFTRNVRIRYLDGC